MKKKQETQETIEENKIKEKLEEYMSKLYN